MSISLIRSLYFLPVDVVLFVGRSFQIVFFPLLTSVLLYFPLRISFLFYLYDLSNISPDPEPPSAFLLSLFHLSLSRFQREYCSEF